MTPMPTSPSEPFGDYETILAAVQATPRGRWFLAEYARRNRQADTQTLLAAIGRLEGSLRGEAAVPLNAGLQAAVAEIAERIARTRQAIAAMPLDPGERRPGDDDFGAVVRAGERAISNILAAAEHIQETAWTLREQGFKPETCDFLDAQATDIYTACSFQDLASQQVHKVVETLRDVESRVRAITDLWSAASTPPSVEAPSVIPTDEAAVPAPDEAAQSADALSAESAPSALDILERDAGGKPLHTFPHPALETLSAEEKIALFT
jgi:chemotaxis regulatin CheY-phosphate phosphatase CheZ